MTADPTTPEGRAELRRLLDEAKLGTLEADCCPAAAIVYDEHGISVFSDCYNDAVAEAAAAGMNALPALLDALDYRDRKIEQLERTIVAGDEYRAALRAEWFARAEKAEAALAEAQDTIRGYEGAVEGLTATIGEQRAQLESIREYAQLLRALAAVTRDAGGTYLAHTYDEIATTLERKIGDRT